MNSQFKKNLVITYTVSLGLIIISAAASYISINSLLNSTDRVNHTNKVINQLEHTISLLKDAETGQRGYLLSNNEIYLEPYNNANRELPQLIESLRVSLSENPEQVRNLGELNELVKSRVTILDAVIQEKKAGKSIENSLGKGRMYMDSCRAVVDKMENIEQALLVERTEKQNRFAGSTPALVVIASFLSILVTIISFRRIMKDFERRTALQQELLEKDEQIARRIELIQGVATKISSGDYKIKVEDKGTDALSNIAGSLNVMAASLDESFTDLSDKQWLQTGVASLNDEMIGEKDMETLTRSILHFVAEYSDSQAGAFYLINREGNLEIISSYALSGDNKKVLQPGEGLAGQSAMAGKTMEVNGLNESDYTLSFVSGNVKPASVIAIPVIFNRAVKGVIELASMNEFTPLVKSFFETVGYNAGIAINTAHSRQKVQELLEETQAQSEELQAQQSELENVNAELEAQAEKLQASEEELRVQQEELQQANQELEERSRLLEEKNELILERNLEIQGKAEELELSTKYKSEFLANMSHELRTPLNSILLLSRLLSENHEGNLSTDQIEYAGVIQNSGNSLLMLIDEILDLSKIEAGKMELEYADIKMEEIANSIQSLFAPLAKEKGIGFSVEVSDDVPGMIETDKLRLEQVLRNLISNALKFTKKGSVSLKISKHQDKAISFSVKDTGIGIPADKQQTIFEAFQQADGSTRRQYGGTGLGLSISRELAKLLGGEIKLKSEVNKGSEFTLVVPQQKGVLKKEELRPAPSTVPTESIAEPLNLNHNDNRFITDVIPAAIPDDRDLIQPGDKVILIIEDDTGFARSILDYTRAKGYKGLVAVRGDEGVSLAKQFLPLGILLDVQLPVKSGWEVMEELKSNIDTRPIPVHMMSSHEVKTKSLSKGAVDFINKPVAFEKLGEMFNKIEQALSRHPKKVLIVEENTKHAEALSYFLGNYEVHSEIKNSIEDGIKSLNKKEVDCVILDMGIPAQRSYDTLEEVKKTPGLENIPIIIFTGKNLSNVEERKIKQYADSIVIKTAHSYQRILDEVSLFLHLVEENKKDTKTTRYKKLGELGEVLRGKTVLIADDDVRNIFSLTKSLEAYGMNVIAAIDGKDALKQLNEHAKVDLVLMDMMMPEMDGYESTRRIREEHKYRNLPVIAVTAKAMTGDREKCIAAGASDYITKPVDVDQLISLLRVWLYE